MRRAISLRHKEYHIENLLSKESYKIVGISLEQALLRFCKKHHNREDIEVIYCGLSWERQYNIYPLERVVTISKWVIL